MIDLRAVRPVLPAAAIVIAVLLAAFARITWPRMEQLSALRAEYEGLSEQASQIASPAAAPQAPEAGQMADLVRRVTEINAAIADPTRAYDRLVELARQNGLQVESITPARSESEGGRVDVFGWSMVATGDFNAIVEFIDALNAVPGLHRVATMRLSPAMADGATGLTLNLSVEFLRLTVPDALADGAPGESIATGEATP